MVPSHSLIMGNGSIKGHRLQETCLASSIKETPVWESVEPLKMRIAHLEEELARRDRELRAQENQLQSLQRELEAKVSQIDKLQDAIGYNSLGRSPPAPLRHSRRLLSVINQGSMRFHRVAVEVHRRLKAKEGVSAEPTTRHFCHDHRAHRSSTERQHIRKDSGTKKLINEALMKNDFLKKLEPQHTREMVDCMYEKIYGAEQLVIQEGEPGNFLYVLAEGLLEVIQNGKFLGQMRPGTAFGELAILYNCKRTATVKAVSQSHIWALDRQTFQTIMMRSTQARHEEYFSFLRSVSLLKDLPEEKLAKIIDCLEIDYFDKGEYIIREGEEGNTFFIIAKGEVSVTQTTEGFTEPQEIKTLRVGDYFGEKALISEDVRSANIIAKENDTQCLVVDRDNFNEMVGTYEELQAYLREYVEELSLSDERRNAVPQSPLYERSPEAAELRRLKEKATALSSTSFLKELQVVATLGMGGFGRVELVKLKDSEDTAFALKCIKKKHIVDTRQQEHIYSEKIILQQTNSNFIVRLFRTFRDDKFVYMLLEVCLGGELWSLLRDMSCFDEPTARFCTGCVLEAFDYLHGKGIVYRDLKPENLLLDAEGYVKMADFGFAKKIGLGKKTWTFCGTPEYVAPEVIMNKGHDFGADCWSLGILIFELLIGSPPFTGSDPIRIYTMVLHGIEKVDIPKRISKRPEDLIRRLCKLNPAERLGNKKNGIIDIKKHKWFQGFNWEGLRRRKLMSPLRRELKGPLDHSYFDMFPPELEEPPDEFSGWDKDF
ncbi:cGMP-dependent protein kinase 2 isoform X1 [Danio rerio]|uniref:cGMP-dependent protein kinase n=2 Tax=Danio rerio TaxID=7955 RepID=A0A8M9Q118_DANRE|nr:cGMP-dependent protein kinase 2-like [Danio rerio]XP_021336392.1 cGMP-dependent protein kinase 2-like [Danio rerio]|eukprot:XP_021328301.1 cGMP-dependent protein kinase 2-like [Danio rerio]